MKNLNTLSSWIVGIGLILGCTLPAQALAQEADCLNVHVVGGTEVYSIPLDDIHKIIFDDNQATVWYNEGETQALTYGDLWKITFGDQSVAIDEVESTSELQIVYRSGDNQLEVVAASPIESLAVYNLQGHLMLQLSPRTEIVSLTLADLPAGIYIVRVGNAENLKTQKIIKY